MRRWLVSLAVAAIMMPVAAQAMSVDQFLAKANALKAQGMMALLSPDVGVLKAEMADLRSELRTEMADLKTQMAELKHDLTRSMATMLFVSQGVLVSIVGLLVALR